MNKTDLVKYVSDKTMITERDAGIIVDVLLNGIKEGIMDGERITIQNFGSFFHSRRAARKAVNPKTNEPVDVPEKIVVKFKLADAVNEKMNENLV
jgi:DNA-binding protein HU-beta